MALARRQHALHRGHPLAPQASAMTATATRPSPQPPTSSPFSNSCKATTLTLITPHHTQPTTFLTFFMRTRDVLTWSSTFPFNVQHTHLTSTTPETASPTSFTPRRPVTRASATGQQQQHIAPPTPTTIPTVLPHHNATPSSPSSVTSMRHTQRSSRPSHIMSPLDPLHYPAFWQAPCSCIPSARSNARSGPLLSNICRCPCLRGQILRFMLQNTGHNNVASGAVGRARDAQQTQHTQRALI